MNKKQAKKINKELKVKGAFIKFFLGSYTKSKFKFCNKIIDVIFKGNALTKKINYQSLYIKRDDGTKLRICVYTPKQPVKNAVGLLWLHGGGYAMGQPEQDIIFIKEFILNSSCVVVAPEYTLSVKKPYPAALDDCYLALGWLVQNANKLNVKSSKIFVGGDSAGGGLTAALSLLVRDRGEYSIAFQMPLYPMLDNKETESSKNNNAPVWDTKSNKLAWKLYLGDLYNNTNITKYAVPANEIDYTNLPPTLTYVGDIEPFKDETITYVDNLKNAKTKVKFKIFKGCFHGFDIVGEKTKIGKEAKQFLIDGFMFAVKNYSKKQPKSI